MQTMPLMRSDVRPTDGHGDREEIGYFKEELSIQKPEVDLLAELQRLELLGAEDHVAARVLHVVTGHISDQKKKMKEFESFTLYRVIYIEKSRKVKQGIEALWCRVMAVNKRSLYLILSTFFFLIRASVRCNTPSPS